MKTAVPERAQQGFKVCGLWPCDHKVFNDDDFEAAPEDTPAAPVILGTVAPQQKTPRSSMRTILKQPNRISLQAPAAPIVKVPHRNQ